MLNILITVYNWIDDKKTDIFWGFVLQGNIERDLKKVRHLANILEKQQKKSALIKLTFITNMGTIELWTLFSGNTIIAV